MKSKLMDLITTTSAVGEAFDLGVNAVSLGDERVLSGAGAGELNQALRSHGLEVLDPDLEMFTRGGGGAHCLRQALRRERVAAAG